jgi:hypothetical protein
MEGMTPAALMRLLAHIRKLPPRAEVGEAAERGGAVAQRTVARA